MNKLILIVCVALIGVAGCDDRKQPAQKADTPQSATARPTPDDLKDWQPKHPTPQYSLAIEKSDTEPPTYSVVWTAKVDSSGWKMTTESVLVEESMRSWGARAYVIVHEPGPHEKITMEPEVLTGRHDCGTQVVHLAELSVKHTVLDSKPTYPQMYAVVKQAGAPSGE